MPVTCLVVDDDPVQRRLLEAALNRLGHRVVQAADGDAALAMLEGPRGGEIRLVMLDLVMPGLDGMGTLAAMRERGLMRPVIVQTSKGSIDTVVSAMRAGANDFCVKPVGPERLRVSVENALKMATMETIVRSVEHKRDSRLTFGELIGTAASMEKAVALGTRAARSQIPVLLEGESGVGKELFARAIHGEGKLAGKPFIAVNCGALPETLAESILFGHEKGAFTGATARHAGKFREAHGGTLFLDEVGELPLELQVKLLRAVQEGEVDPVGSDKPVKVDVRLVSATNRDLIAAVGDGQFREDLFYRLNVFPIRLPALRERRGDIAALAEHFCARFAVEEGRRGLDGLTRPTLALLERQDWPGNVRQLENAVFRAVVLADGAQLTPEDFPQIAPAVSTSTDEGESAGGSTAIAPDGHADPVPLAELERRAIVHALAFHEGRMAAAARALGIGRSTLYRKLKEYGLDDAA